MVLHLTPKLYIVEVARPSGVFVCKTMQYSYKVPAAFLFCSVRAEFSVSCRALHHQQQQQQKYPEYALGTKLYCFAFFYKAPNTGYRCVIKRSFLKRVFGNFFCALSRSRRQAFNKLMDTSRIWQSYSYVEAESIVIDASHRLWRLSFLQTTLLQFFSLVPLTVGQSTSLSATALRSHNHCSTCSHLRQTQGCRTHGN